MSNITSKDPNDTALPVEWGYRTLGEIAEITMGNSPPGESYNEEGIGVPLVNGPVEFSEGAFGLTKKIKFTTAPTKVCRSGDFLICVRGSTTGRTNIAAFDACIGRGVASIHAKMSQRYLNHFVRTLEKRIHASGKGSTFPSISQQQLADLSIPLPSPDNPKRSTEEQKRIADILDKADAIRRKRQEAIDLLPSLRSAVFHDRFGDPIANPKSWHVVELQDLFETSPNYGTMIKPSDEVRGWLDLRVANIQDGKLDLSSRKYVDLPHNMIERHEVRDGDLLLARAIGSLEHLGKCIIAHPGDQKWAFDSHLMRIRFDSTRVLPRFVHAFLQSPGGRHEFLSNSRRSAVQFNVNTKEMACIRIPLPPLEEQRCFIEELDTIDQFAIRHETASNESRALFNSLVQRAFRGNL